MIRKNIIFGIAVCSLFACSSGKNVAGESSSVDKKEQRESGSNSKSSFSVKEEKALPVLWHQTSAEYKALCFQAYNVARQHLERLMDEYDMEERNGAIIMDIDETILDNSKYNAYLTINNKTHSEELWAEWVEQSVAGAIPGAKEFLEFAIGSGIEVFFISNRLSVYKGETVNNFIENELPFDEGNILLARTPGESKIARRSAVENSHYIVMYIGDNLADFSHAYEEEKSLYNRDIATNSLKEEFGTKYILLPNIMYGDWKNVLQKEGAADQIKAY